MLLYNPYVRACVTFFIYAIVFGNEWLIIHNSAPYKMIVLPSAFDKIKFVTASVKPGNA